MTREGQKAREGSQPVKAAKQARLAAIVIAATMLLWLGAQAVGAHFNWEARYAFLFDLAALAAFVWALVVIYQIWRSGRA